MDNCITCLKPRRVFKGDSNYSPHYVRGNRSAPQIYELRVKFPGKAPEKFDFSDMAWPIASLERIAREQGAEWAESEAISGFYSLCRGYADTQRNAVAEVAGAN